MDPPDPFLDRPCSLPAVPWVQWIRDFHLFLDSQRCEGEEEKSRQLMLYLGLEGRIILWSLPDPPDPETLIIQTDPIQWRRFDGTESYGRLVRALTAHYERERTERTWIETLKILMTTFIVSAALVFIAHLYQGKIKEAALMAVFFALICARFILVMVPERRFDSWDSWWSRVRWWFRVEFPDVFLLWLRCRYLFVPRVIEKRFQEACTEACRCFLAVVVLLCLCYSTVEA